MSESERRFAGSRLLALGGADAVAIAEAFEGAAIQSAMLSDDATRPRAGHSPVVTPAALVQSRLFRDAHVVVATIESGQARALLFALTRADLAREVSRPIIVMVADDGLPSGAAADVLVFTIEDDCARYRAMAAKAGFDVTNALVSTAPDHRALLDQCAALLGGQDMRGSALPLRPLIEPASRPSRGFFGRLILRNGRGA